MQQQFFPNSTRLELLVTCACPKAPACATQAEVEKLRPILDGEQGIANYVAYVGTGSPRFYLPLDQQLPATNFAQFVVLTRRHRGPRSLRSRLIARPQDEFPNVRSNVIRLENGPPVGYPVQFRVLGPTSRRCAGLAGEVAAVMRANPIWPTSTRTGTSSPRCCGSRWTSTRRACWG